MAALRILCLILLSGGMLTHPVLLQTASCCCAQDASSGISQADSQSTQTPAEGCPNCRAARTSTEVPVSVATLRTCTCQKHSAPVGVARTLKVAQADILLATVEPLEHSIERPAELAQVLLRSGPPGRVIPARILKCSWRL